MSSEKKIRANRANALKSIGPKTERGKNNSKLNATVHGLFSAKLCVSDADKPAYEVLRADLLDQLKPTTAVRRLIFDAILCAAWRCTQAVQRETRQLGAETIATDSVAPPERNSVTEWYGKNRRATRAALRLVYDAIEEVRTGGHVPETMIEELKLAFGNDFVTRVKEWETADMFALRSIYSMRRKHELWGTGNPDDIGEQGPVVVKDPAAEVHMQVKLLEQQAAHLTEVEHILEQGEAQRTRTPPEPGYRYVAAAFKMFMTLLAFYDHLGGMGM